MYYSKKMLSYVRVCVGLLKFEMYAFTHKVLTRKEMKQLNYELSNIIFIIWTLSIV
jgi:hypothetical protein